MKYLSTRGDKTERHFCDILLEGLAPDGGLYLPTAYPRVDAATLARWRGLPYADLAFEILSLYIDDIPAADLKAIVHRTYTEASSARRRSRRSSRWRRGWRWSRCPTGRRWPSRTWRCSCWASCSSTNWAAAARR